MRVVDADNEEHEAERVVARIQSTPAPNGRGASKDWKDFAVLYRANHQARVFEQALRKAQIPYKVSGGQSFFDRAEIKDLCAWLRLVVNNDDDPAFLRAVTTPKRGIGHQTLQSLGVFAGKYKLSLFEALFSSSLGSVLPASAVAQPARVRPLRERPGVPRPPHQRRRGRARLPAAEWLKDIDYEKHLYDGEDSEKLAAVALDQRAGVLRLDGAALRRPDRRRRRRDASPARRRPCCEVAQTISLLSTISEREQDQNVVTLSTLHAAKGLEWPHVMLVGVTEGLLPFKLGDDDNPAGRGATAPMSEGILQRLQEERRLMYVGITRAQRSLAVSWTEQAQEGPRDDRGAAQPLHRRDGAGEGHDEGRPARKAQGPARRIREEGPRHRRRRRRGRRAMNWQRVIVVAAVGRQHPLGLWRAELLRKQQGLRHRSRLRPMFEMFPASCSRTTKQAPPRRTRSPATGGRPSSRESHSPSGIDGCAGAGSP